jgi:hypothetical protein
LQVLRGWLALVVLIVAALHVAQRKGDALSRWSGGHARACALLVASEWGFKKRTLS